jgi:hypothetical protein
LERRSKLKAAHLIATAGRSRSPREPLLQQRFGQIAQ